jgi:hypothetical protein
MKIELVFTIHRDERVVGAQTIGRYPTNAISFWHRPLPDYPVNGTLERVLTEDL